MLHAPNHPAVQPSVGKKEKFDGEVLQQTAKLREAKHDSGLEYSKARHKKETNQNAKGRAERFVRGKNL